MVEVNSANSAQSLSNRNIVNELNNNSNKILEKFGIKHKSLSLNPEKHSLKEINQNANRFSHKILNNLAYKIKDLEKITSFLDIDSNNKVNKSSGLITSAIDAGKSKSYISNSFHKVGKFLNNATHIGTYLSNFSNEQLASDKPTYEKTIKSGARSVAQISATAVGGTLAGLGIGALGITGMPVLFIGGAVGLLTGAVANKAINYAESLGSK